MHKNFHWEIGWETWAAGLVKGAADSSAEALEPIPIPIPPGSQYLERRSRPPIRLSLPRRLLLLHTRQGTITLRHSPMDQLQSGLRLSLPNQMVYHHYRQQTHHPNPKTQPLPTLHGPKRSDNH